MKKNNKGGSFLAFPFLLIGGIILLWWNEGNYVKVASAIKEAQSDYVQVKDAKVDSANEGKVIATNGKLVVNEDAKDEAFKINVNSALLSRKVEMYQWDENCDEDNNCSYSKKWDDTAINSSSFKEGHTNPSMPYDSEIFYSNSVSMGDFSLTKDNLQYLSANKEYTLKQEDAINNSMTIVDNYLFKGKGTLSNPEVGDLRIKFNYLEATDVSAVGVQSGSNITGFVGKSGKTVMYTIEGIHTGEELFQKLEDNNKMMTWLLRLVGCILLISAIACIFTPLTKLANYVPILGGLVGTAAGLVSIVVGLALSIIIIAVAWVAYRPVASIIAIVVAVGLVVLLITRGKKKKENSPEQPQETA